MNSVEALNKNKEGILASLRARGPSIPVQVAKVINTSPLFASAFLSELKAEKKVNISHMRMGSSPIYYLPGQEEQLANFSEYLNQREREAFFLLKESLVLEDDAQTPVVRVALRAIKDFAIPLNVRVDGETKTFWKYFTLNDKEAGEKIRELINGPSESKEEVVKEEVVKEESREAVVPKEEVEQLTQEVKPIEEPQKQTPLPQKKEEKSVAPIFNEHTKEVKKPKTAETDFSKTVKDYLASKDIEVFDIISEKKKEFVAKIRLQNYFGMQSYYLIAKDKKNVTDNDLVVALQKAQSEKLPAAVMSNGNLNKKAQKHLEDWGNLVKFEKIE